MSARAGRGPGACDTAIVDLSRGGTLGVYVVTGVMSPVKEKDGVTVPRGRWDKGRKADVLAVTCLDVDIDLRGTNGGHAADDERLPAMADASATVAELRPLIGRPALTVHSGGGLHLRYALAEPVAPASPEMVDTYARWKHVWQSAFARRGFTVDPTPLTNPAGLLRVAGTVNSKYGRPVRILKANPGAQLAQDDLAALPEAPKPEPRTAWKRAGDGTGYAGSTDAPDALLPLERLARTPGALAMLLEGGGLVSQNAAGTLWGFPRADGSISDPNIVVYVDELGRGEDTPVLVERVVGHGARFNSPPPEGWGLDGHAWSAASVLVNRFCGGDAALAARIVARNGADPELITNTVATRTPDQLAKIYTATRGISPEVEVIPAGQHIDGVDPDPHEGAETLVPDDSTLAPIGQIEIAPTETLTAPVTGVAPVADANVTEDVVGARLPQTPYGFAERIAMYSGARWRTSGGRWYRWDGRVWQVAYEAAMRGEVLAVARHIQVHEAAVLAKVALAKHLASPPSATKAGDDRSAAELARAAADTDVAALRAWGARFESGRAQDDALRQLSAIRGMSVREDAWDADPNLLNTPAGVVDLRTGERLPHDPRRMMSQITRGSGHDVPMSEDLRTLLDALARTDAGLPDFLGDTAGVAITGHSPRIFTHWHGAAGVGKSTVNQALVAALGSYASEVQADQLAQSQSADGEKPTPFLHGLRGVRLLYCDEAANVQLATNTVKTLSAGGTMRTRTLHSEPVAWRSQLTLVMAGQAELTFRGGADAGIQDRLLAVLVSAKSRPARVDPGLVTRMRSQEGLDAVLAWAIRHAVDWHKRGGSRDAIRVPDYVRISTDEYVESVNPIAEWWDTMVIEKPVAGWVPDAPASDAVKRAAVTSAEMHESYLAWHAERYRNASGRPHTVATNRFIRLVEEKGHKLEEREMVAGVRARRVYTLQVKGVVRDEQY